MTRAIERFVALFGDISVGDITSRQILDYRDLIMNMPCNLQLTKIAAGGQTLREIIEKHAASPDAPRSAAASVKKDIGGLSAVLGLVPDAR